MPSTPQTTLPHKPFTISIAVTTVSTTTYQSTHGSLLMHRHIPHIPTERLPINLPPTRTHLIDPTTHSPYNNDHNTHGGPSFTSTDISQQIPIANDFSPFTDSSRSPNAGWNHNSAPRRASLSAAAKARCVPATLSPTPSLSSIAQIHPSSPQSRDYSSIDTIHEAGKQRNHILHHRSRKTTLPGFQDTWQPDTLQRSNGRYYRAPMLLSTDEA